MYPTYLTIDCEVTGATNGTFGNPFCDANKLVVVGHRSPEGDGVAYVDELTPLRGQLPEFLYGANEESMLSVGFNWKFDAHWLRRYHAPIPSHYPVWDCQLAHFIIHNQQSPLPSLAECATYYGLEDKYIDVETEYWRKGIDNDQVPSEVLSRRVLGDVRITSQLFELQCDYLRKNPSKKNLIWIACQDQRVLAEMEWNGLKYDLELSRQEGDKIRERQAYLAEQLTQIIGIPGINWSSGDQLSYVLFGGCLKIKQREAYTFVYKDGSTAPKERWAILEHDLPRRLEPFKGTEYTKGGVYSTDAAVLKKLKPEDADTKRIIELIQENRKLDKQVGTYYHGLPKLYEEMGWTNNIIHGQLQSAVTVTGRLSSKAPNQQNMDHEIRKCIISRF